MPNQTDTPLWETNHPYYCSESNYYASGYDQPYERYDSWQDFLDCEGDADMDYNLVFRWDWQVHDPSDWLDADEDDKPDPARPDTLQVFWMGQRKGLFRCTEVKVGRDDEPSVRTWLTERGEYLRKVWQPLLDGPAPANL